MLPSSPCILLSPSFHLPSLHFEQIPSCGPFFQPAGRSTDKLPPAANPHSTPLPSASQRNAGKQLLSARALRCPWEAGCVSSGIQVISAPLHCPPLLVSSSASSAHQNSLQSPVRAQPASLHLKWNSAFVAAPASPAFYSLLNQQLGSNLQVLAVFSSTWLQHSLVALFASPLGFL